MYSVEMHSQVLVVKNLSDQESALSIESEPHMGGNLLSVVCHQ